MSDAPLTLRLKINGRDRAVLAGADETLLAVLREQLALTGTKRGCNQGACGACTVLADGAPVRACLALAANCEDWEIQTIEGLADDALTPVQQALIDHGGFQCGFCTPGMALTLAALFAETPHPDRDAIVEALSGNICRCTGYRKIVAAALAVSVGGGA